MSIAHFTHRSKAARGIDLKAELTAIVAVIAVSVTLVLLVVVSNTGSHPRTAIHPLRPVPASAVQPTAASSPLAAGVPAGYVRDPATHALLALPGTVQAGRPASAPPVRELSHGATP